MEEIKDRILNILLKLIIVVIFILFIVWLLSISIRKTNNLVTDETVINSIYQQNLDRMKEAGISYYTLERLPEKTGDIKKITLEEMYDLHLLLQIIDEDGNACSNDDSYVEVTKLENEYKMKIKLECPKRDDYIIVYLGCYDYCKGFICEKQEPTSATDNNNGKGNIPENSSNNGGGSNGGGNTNHTITEYEYVKRTNVHWTDWSNWSSWQKTAVNESDKVKVETKVVYEDYTYEVEREEIIYADPKTGCPDGYEPNPTGKNCRKITNETMLPKCDATIPGGVLYRQEGLTCIYKMTSNAKPISCPTVSGKVLIDETTTTCIYGILNDTTEPRCDSTIPGGVLYNQEGLTCIYKMTSQTASLICPQTPSGFTYIGTSGNYCIYKKFLNRAQGTYIPANTSTRIYEYVSGPIALQDCDGCGYYYGYVYNVFQRKPLSKICPDGYQNIGGTCYKLTSTHLTCPAGYIEYNKQCIRREDVPKTCPDGYQNIGGTCYKLTSTYLTCPAGYIEQNNTCKKVLYANHEKSCPAGYQFTDDTHTRCYKTEIKVVTMHGTKAVTYYRYATREYIGGTVDYKWSTSNHDTNLLSQGYTLTGRTRTK